MKGGEHRDHSHNLKGILNDVESVNTSVNKLAENLTNNFAHTKKGEASKEFTDHAEVVRRADENGIVAEDGMRRDELHIRLD